MSAMNEIDAITAIENTLSQLESTEARDRVLTWAWDKFSSRPLPTVKPAPETSSATKKPKKAKASTKAKPRSTILKDLNLNQEGKKSFKDFVDEIQPKYNYEKCSVAVYYLIHELGITNISLNHVFTCYKDVKWLVPDLYNVLILASSRYGFLNTSNMEDISITPIGENFVEFDLPQVPKENN